MIIATTDGSQRSTRIFGHAAALAAACNEEFEVLQVFDPEGLERDAAIHWVDQYRQCVEDIEHEMRALLTDVSVTGQPHAVPLLNGESVVDAILRSTDALGASIIAIDSRGHGALRHALLGSIAMDVLAQSRQPVMLAGPGLQPAGSNGGSTVLATSDGSPAAEEVFKHLGALCGVPSVKVVLASIYVPANGDKGEAAEIAQREAMLEDLRKRYLGDAAAEIVVRRCPEFTTPDAILIQVAKEAGATAIAMSSHGHSARRHLLTGSFANQVLDSSPVPVILARV